MPFCLCWADHHWTRRWDGAEQEILIEQSYCPEDGLAFIPSLIPFFQDPRYIRLNGAPLLIVYYPQHLPDARRTVKIWREYCATTGIGRIHVSAALVFGNEYYARFDFDSGVEFPPHGVTCEPVNDRIDFHEEFQGSVVLYHDVAQRYLDREYQHTNVFRTVFPSWDNTPRMGGRALAIVNGTPENYEYWLAESIRRTARQFPGEKRFVFINAWNEWAEGCHLEPDRRFGRQFLEATLVAKQGGSHKRAFTDIALPPCVARTLLTDLTEVFSFHLARLVGRARSILNRFPRVRRAVRPIVRAVVRLNSVSRP